MEEKGLAARVTNMGSTHLPALYPFVVQQTSPTQRDWIVNSNVSAHTCRERNQFGLNCALWPPHPVSLRNGKTISALDAGDTLNWVSIPSIAGDRTPRETFTKSKQSVERLRALEHRAPGDVPNVKHPGDDSRTPSRRPAMASTNGPSQMVQPQLNKPKSIGFDGESRRLAIASTNGLSHVTVDGIYPNTEETGGLACGTGQRSVKRRSNSPGGLSAPTSAVEDADGPTTQVPTWKRQKDTVKESVDTSTRSDRSGSRQQGDLTPKLEFGGKTIKTDVRSDEKQENGEGHTYQRAPNRPLDPLTRNAPPTGKTDGWRATTSAESSDVSTTQGPGSKHQEDTVNGSVNASVPSDRRRSRHQGDFTPKFKFGGEIIKMDVRVDENQTDRDRHTSKRVQNRPLDPLTRNVPPTGETDDLRGQFAAKTGIRAGTTWRPVKTAVKEQ